MSASSPASPYPTATLKPADGLVVRCPVSGQPLAADGEDKPLDTYWCRRLADGDVLRVEPESPAPARTAAKPTLKPV